MAGFWNEIREVVFRHTGAEHLTWIDERLSILEDNMTSAQGDIEALNQVYSELDQWSNEVASELDSLREHAETGNVSAADVAARLRPIVDRLKSAGSDGTVAGDGHDSSTDTDPTNSPTTDSPVVNPAPDAPTDVPTADPTVNPTDIPEESLPESGDPTDFAVDGAVEPTGGVSNDQSAPSSDTVTPSNSSSADPNDPTNDF